MEILKLGSKGEDVKKLQEYLDLKVDGEFGPITERAVKDFQKKHIISVDGVVGKKTWEAMGYVSTDLSENKNQAKGLEIKQHFLPIGEYKNQKTKKEWVFLHHTAGWENPIKTIDAWANDKRGAIATEFVLGGQNIRTCDKTYDGVMVQAFPTGHYAWHLGTGSNKLHSCSVGLEVCNFGQLKDGKTYVGTVAHQVQIVKLAKPFRGHQFWHKYSDLQITGIKDWLLFIADRDDIDIRKGLVELIHKKGADAFDHFDLSLVEKTRGLWTHTNVRKDKVDMFPQPELIDMLLTL